MAIAAGLGGGCGELVGLDYSVAEDEVPASEFAFRDAACGTCMQACREPLAECAESSSCRPYQQCLADCPAADGACSFRCTDALRGGRFDSTMAKVTVCALAECTRECAIVTHWDFRGEACADCVRLQCTEEEAGCAADPLCVSLRQCLYGCNQIISPTPSCHHACLDELRAYASAPGETPASPTAGFCRATRCRAECPAAVDCYQGYDWPLPESPFVPVEVLVHDGIVIELVGQGRADVALRACPPESIGCVGSIERRTGPDGIALFEQLDATVPWRFEYDLDPPLSGFERLAFYPGRPFRRPALVSFPSVPSQGYEMAPDGTPWQEGKGAILVAPRDCAFATMFEAIYEIEPVAGGVAYCDLNKPCSLERSESTSSALFFQLDPGLYTITVKQAENVKAQQRVVAQANTLTRVSIVPDSR